MQYPHSTQTTPQKYIAWINNSNVAQITYTALYKHLELLCSDSLQLCIYMTTSHILPPNAWKCYQHYFPSTPIHLCPSMTSQGTTFKELLSLLSSVDTINNAWDMHAYFYQMLLFICHYIWRTTTKTKLHSNNNNNDNKKHQSMHELLKIE